MPNNASHKKRLRQSLVRRQHNRQVRSEIRTRTKKLLELESPEEATTQLSQLYALLDRAARRNIIPANAASRRKARVARHVRDLAGS